MDVLERIIDELTGDIIITQSEYDDKTIAEYERNHLLNIIFNDLELGYKGEDLRLKGYAVMDYIKLVYPNKYAKKLKELQNAQRDKEDSNPGNGQA